MHKAPHAIRLQPPLPNVGRQAKTYDPELLYVECGRCGNPVIWEQGRTTELLQEAGLASSRLDARHLVLTDGCPTCAPDETFYETRVVRLAETGEPGLEDLRNAEGNA